MFTIKQIKMFVNENSIIWKKDKLYFYGPPCHAPLYPPSQPAPCGIVKCMVQVVDIMLREYKTSYSTSS